MRAFIVYIVLATALQVSASTAPAKPNNWFGRTPKKEEEEKKPEPVPQRNGWFQKSQPEPVEEEEEAPKPQGWFHRSPPDSKEDQTEESPPKESKARGKRNAKEEASNEEPKNQPEEAQSESSSPPTEEETPKEEKKRGFFGRSKQKEGAADTNTTTTTTTNDDDKSSNTTAVEKPVTNPPPENTNRTTTTTAATTQSPFIRHPNMFLSPPSQFQQRQSPHSPVVIMGMDGRPQRMPGQPGGSTSSAVMAEAIASIVSVAIRFWFLTSLTKWFADEEIKSLKKPQQHFIWERLNDVYAKDTTALKTALSAKPSTVSERKWRRHTRRLRRKERRLNKQKNDEPVATLLPKPTSLDDMFNRTVIVVDVSKSEKGDLDLDHLEQVVTFVLSEHRSQTFGTDPEVVLLVESPGGGVSTFGLAAAQIQRLSYNTGITTTACVDRVAASGGYMIASQCQSIIAAPFAAVGSIGVIREGLNFHKALEKYGVAPIVMTAGVAKAPLSTYGEVTKRGMEITQKNLEKTHDAFRDLVVRGRPVLADTIEEVATGDVFWGEEALELNLVDVVMTSEEYIMGRIAKGDRVLKLHRMPHYMRNRRLPGIHPLDFLKSGHKWLAKQDVPNLLSRLVQTTSFLKFVQHVARNREF